MNLLHSRVSQFELPHSDDLASSGSGPNRSSASELASSSPDATSLRFLRSFNDFDLVSQTRMLVRDEARATRQVLLHLMEIERREIHLARGFKSLHEFAVEVLGYSDGSAARRVSAMRLMREIPETAEQLIQGSLTLETMSTLQKHFRENNPSQEVRTTLVNQAQNLSKRELEKKLGKPELTAVYLKPELVKKLNELKFVFGMTSLERILEKLADQALAQARAKERMKIEKNEVRSDESTVSEIAHATARAKPVAVAPPAELSREQCALRTKRSRYVPRPAKRHLIERDQARCMYVDSATQRRCSATQHLEFDHLQPFAMGGNTSVENLRVLCANHNRYRARRMGLGRTRRR
jgi:hypothetical protein